MQVGESTLKTLLEGQKQFQVPLHQRQYAWADSQLSQLWEDVLEQYDLLRPDENGTTPNWPPTHFLGSMVLVPSHLMPAHGATPFLVIDVGHPKHGCFTLAAYPVTTPTAFQTTGQSLSYPFQAGPRLTTSALLPPGEHPAG